MSLVSVQSHILNDLSQTQDEFVTKFLLTGLRDADKESTSSFVVPFIDFCTKQKLEAPMIQILWSKISKNHEQYLQSKVRFNPFHTIIIPCHLLRKCPLSPEIGVSEVSVAQYIIDVCL